MKQIKRFVALTALLVTAFFVYGQSVNSEVTLAWDASPSTGVAGYEIRYGTDTNWVTWTSTVNAGTNLSVKVTGLNTGVKYYFVAFAFDQYGQYSDPSNMVEWRPLPPKPAPPKNLFRWISF